MGQIFLVRHGQASFGSADYDRLSPLGQEQAKLLGEWFARSGQTFHRVVVGGMRRHRQTADACMGMLSPHGADAEWHTDPDFNEYDHHEVLIRHRPEFEDHAQLQRFLASSPKPKLAFQQEFEKALLRWMSGRHDADYRESWPFFRERCVAAFKRVLAQAGKSQNIIIFTSGGPIATLCQHLFGLQDRQVAELNWSFVNCSVTKVFYRADAVSLSYLNSYAHFEGLGQPHTITYR